MTVRLTRQATKYSTIVRLEGHLRHDTVDVVRHECRPRPDEPPRLEIDLQQLGHVDTEGLRLLKELRSRPDVRLLNCSPLLATLIASLPD